MAMKAATDTIFPELPTFPLEVGWRTVYDPTTETEKQLPITLLDILYPTEDDVDVVATPQSPYHARWTSWLTTMIQTYLSTQKLLVMHDVLIHWGRKNAPPKSPDVAVIPGGLLPDEDDLSYHVGRDGPPPTFIIEITSKETRKIDLQAKPIFYAALGVKEYLIIDIRTRRNQPWRLLGYRLEDSPYYREIKADVDGSISFPSLGLRFRAINREKIEVFDLTTGERFLTPVEQKVRADLEAARAEQETERADLEATARKTVEAELAATLARLHELEARYNLQIEKTKNDSE
jgi:Uma2 family endonuclease